jgi:flagellar biosynthesis chaperone FliJ
MSLNLTVAHAKLRLNDSAFQTVGRSFQQLLDMAASSVEEATIALKNARGEKLTDDERFVGQTELDSSLEKIKKEAEHIIQTVLAIKKTQRINRQV